MEIRVTRMNRSRYIFLSLIGLVPPGFLILTATVLYADGAYCGEENNPTVAQSPIVTGDSLSACLTLDATLRPTALLEDTTSRFTDSAFVADLFTYDEFLPKPAYGTGGADAITDEPMALADPQNPDDFTFIDKAEDGSVIFRIILATESTSSKGPATPSARDLMPSARDLIKWAADLDLPLVALVILTLGILTYAYGVVRRVWRAASTGRSLRIVIR